MKDTVSNNQAPIFRFFVKHKWRIILPLLFAAFFWALPRYQTVLMAVQQNLFIKSSGYSQNELKQEVTKIQNEVLSNNFLQNLVTKYDLYQNESSEYLRVEKLRRAITVRLEEEDLVEGVGVFIWTSFRKENAQFIAEISNDLAAQFEQNKQLHIDKYVSKPYDANDNRSWVFFGSILQGLLMLVIPLILLWEIPFLFYSPRTKETVFEPLKSDWQNELNDAKLRKQTWKTHWINIRYTYAFISAMWQKSPIGDLIEYVRKIAR